MSYIDLRDIAEAANDPDHDEHTEAVAIRAAFIADGLANDADSFTDYAENEPVVIPADEFQDYARELAEDIGAVSDDAGWPGRHIDWQAAADELAHDYSTFTYDGTDYYVRSL